MKKLSVLSVSLFIACFLTSFNVSASTISGGVDNSQLISRTTRDGASGINFIDLSRTISGNGWVTSFSVYAESYTGSGWGYNTDPRSLALIIFRTDGSNYDVVGTSPLETVQTNQWNSIVTFALPGSGIQVQKGDYLGWYYPYQGSGAFNSTDYSNAGGVIAFNWGGDNVHWINNWGPAQPEATGSIAASAFSGYDGGRTYSINVSGTTVAPVPVPPAFLLLGPGLAGLAAIRRRFGK